MFVYVWYVLGGFGTGYAAMLGVVGVAAVAFVTSLVAYKYRNSRAEYQPRQL